MGEPTHDGVWTPFVTPRISRVDDDLPGPVGVYAMKLADGVRTVRQAQAKRGHVELVRVAARCPGPPFEPGAILEHRLRAMVAGEAPDEVRVEPFVAGRDRRVDREHAVRPDRGPGVIEVDSRGDELAGPLGRSSAE